MSFIDDIATVRHTEPEAIANLAIVLQLCAAGKVRCSEKTQRPAAATVRTVAESLAAGDFYPDDAIAAFAWPLLLQAGGLARLDRTRLNLTSKGRAALGQPAHEVIRTLWQRWPRHAPIDELSRVEEIKGQRAAAALSAAGRRRHTVAAALALCPLGEWLAVDELFTRMRRADLSPTVARSERSLWKLYLSDPEYGSFGYAGHHDWPILEGRYTLAVIFEYAATLGLVDVEYVPPAHARDDFKDLWGADWIDALSRYDGLLAVRLTELGRFAAGFADTYQPPCSVPPGPGGPPPQRAVHDVPATVATLLENVEDSAGQVHDLGLRRVVECADPAVAAQIAGDRTTKAYCTRVGETHLLVSPGADDNFRAALTRLGYPLGGGGPRG